MNNIKKLIIYIVIFFMIIFLIFRKNLKTYLNDNWVDNRCYPHFLLLSGLSDKTKGNNFFDKVKNNFNYCTNNYLKIFLQIFTRPFFELLESINLGIDNIKNTINKFRNMASVLRNMFISLVENTSQRMQNSYGAVIYLQEKMKTLIKKQAAVFEVLKHFLGALPLLFYSFSYGPIPRFAGWLSAYMGVLIALLVICILCVFGGPFVKIASCPVCALCFEDNTLIDMPNNKKKPINEIEIDEYIKGAKVIGILKIRNNNWKLYNYNKIIVSGNHLILENNIWKRIEDCDNSERIYKSCPLRCLITDTHHIYINNYKFKDYLEIDDKDILQQINYAILKKCNNDTSYIQTENNFEHLYQWGFHPDTKVKYKDQYLSIKEIVENNLYSYSILGHVKFKIRKEKMYKLNGIILSGTTLYKNKINWQRVHQCKDSVPITKYNGYLYHLITIDNIVISKNDNDNIFYFRDFIESFDNELNKKIDKLVENRLNIMISR